MTPRERVLAVFTGRKTDRVPVYHTSFSSRAASHVLGREAYVGGGVQQWRESAALWNGPAAHQEFLAKSLQDALALTRATGQDVFRWESWRCTEQPTERIDEYTFAYGPPGGGRRIRQYHPATEIFGIVREEGPGPQSPRTMEELERHMRELREKPIDEGRAKERARRAGELRKEYGGEYFLRFGGGELSIGYGEAVLLEAIAARPDLIGEMLDRQVQERLPVLEALASAGVAAVFGGGDLASSAGPFYSPAAFRELMLPRLQRLTGECRRLGLFHLFGSDGNLWPLAPDLFGRSGVAGYYEVDGRAGMDISRLGREYPNLTLIGANISSVTLARGAVEEVVAETRGCIEAARESGRVVAGVSNAIVPETPPANIDALLDTMEKYR